MAKELNIVRQQLTAFCQTIIVSNDVTDPTDSILGNHANVQEKGCMGDPIIG